MPYQHLVPVTVSILPSNSRKDFKIYVRNESNSSIRISRPRGWDIDAKWLCKRRFSKRNETFIIYEYPEFVYERSAIVFQPKETKIFLCSPGITGENSGRYVVHLQYDDREDKKYNKVKISQWTGVSRDFQFTATIRKGKLSKIELLKIGPSRLTEPRPKHEEVTPLPPAKIPKD